MQVFQEDEGARATALQTLVGALDDPEKFLLAAEIQGYNLSEEAEKKVMAMIEARKTPEPVVSVTDTTGDTTGDTTPVDSAMDTHDTPMKADMGRLRRKALKNIGKNFNFESEFIPDLGALMAKIKACTSEAEVKAVFDAEPDAIEVTQEFKTLTVNPDYAPLLEAIRLECNQINQTKTTQTGPLFTTNGVTFDGVTFKMPEQSAPQVTVNMDTEQMANIISARMEEIVKAIPAPVVNVPAPVINIQENAPDETADVVKAIRRLAKNHE